MILWGMGSRSVSPSPACRCCVGDSFVNWADNCSGLLEWQHYPHWLCGSQCTSSSTWHSPHVYLHTDTIHPPPIKSITSKNGLLTTPRCTPSLLDKFIKVLKKEGVTTFGATGYVMVAHPLSLRPWYYTCIKVNAGQQDDMCSICVSKISSVHLWSVTPLIRVARGWTWKCAKRETRIKCLGKNPKHLTLTH